MNKYPNVAQHKTPEMIRDRKPFNASALTGRIVEGLGPWDSGRLSGADHDQFRLDAEHIDYVVYSYVTPIAWHWTAPDGSTGWHKVSHRFTATTSVKHQSRLYLIPMDTTLPA